MHTHRAVKAPKRCRSTPQVGGFSTQSRAGVGLGFGNRRARTPRGLRRDRRTGVSGFTTCVLGDTSLVSRDIGLMWVRPPGGVAWRVCLVLGLLFSGSCLAGCLSEGPVLRRGSLVAVCAAFSFCVDGGVDALESRSRRPRDG